MGPLGSLHMLLPRLLLHVLILTLDTCIASPDFQMGSLGHNLGFSPPDAFHTHSPNLRYSTAMSQATRKIPQADPSSLRKRRVPVRPPGSKSPTVTSDDGGYIRLYNFEYVFTDDQAWAFLSKIYHGLAALALIGIDVDDAFLALQIGAFTLNIYAVGEALTQSIVLAVLRRIVQLFKLRAGFFLGEGVVGVGAGVRVLFAAGVRLRGVEVLDREMVRPLVELIG